MAAMQADGTSVRCDCCGMEKLAEIHPGMGIEIIDGRHGTKHMATVEPRELITWLAGTTGGSAVMTYVESLFR